MKGRLVFGVFVLAMATACEPVEHNDVYVQLPRGTALTANALRSAEQICLYESELITLFDHARPADDAYDPHLMFWNADRKLYAASYFASQKIERIDAGSIIGYLNEHRAQRVSAFRRDLPRQYRLNLLPNAVESAGGVSDTVIDALGISPDGRIVTLETRQGKGRYPADSASTSDGSRRATLRIPLCDLLWKYREGQVRMLEREGRRQTRHDMRVASPQLLDEFYESMLKTCVGHVCSAK